MATCRVERVHSSQVSTKLEPLGFLLLALYATIQLRRIPPGEAGRGMRTGASKPLGWASPPDTSLVVSGAHGREMGLDD